MEQFSTYLKALVTSKIKVHIQVHSLLKLRYTCAYCIRYVCHPNNHSIVVIHNRLNYPVRKWNAPV